MRLQEYKIKLLRKAKGVSQKYISEITFTDPAKITKVERGLAQYTDIQLDNVKKD